MQKHDELFKDTILVNWNKVYSNARTHTRPPGSEGLLVVKMGLRLTQDLNMCIRESVYSHCLAAHLVQIILDYSTEMFGTYRCVDVSPQNDTREENFAVRASRRGWGLVDDWLVVRNSVSACYM